MKLILPPAIKDKLRLYVHALDNEISGFGKVEFDQATDTCTVVDLKIFEQEVSAGSSDLEGASIAKFITQLVKEGEDLGGWNLWWHSHNTMGVFWSGTDTGTMDANPLDAPFMVSLVTNNKAEYRARIDVYEPVHMYMDELDVVPQTLVDNSQQEAVEAEVAELVSEKVFVRTQAKQSVQTITELQKKEGYWDYAIRDWIPGTEEGSYWDEKEKESEQTELDLDIQLAAELGEELAQESVHGFVHSQEMTDDEIEENAKEIIKKYDQETIEAMVERERMNMDTPYDVILIAEKALDILETIEENKKKRAEAKAERKKRKKEIKKANKSKKK